MVGWVGGGPQFQGHVKCWFEIVVFIMGANLYFGLILLWDKGRSNLNLLLCRRMEVNFHQFMDWIHWLLFFTRYHLVHVFHTFIFNRDSIDIYHSFIHHVMSITMLKPSILPRFSTFAHFVRWSWILLDSLRIFKIG